MLNTKYLVTKRILLPAAGYVGVCVNQNVGVLIKICELV